MQRTENTRRLAKGVLDGSFVPVFVCPTDRRTLIHNITFFCSSQSSQIQIHGVDDGEEVSMGTQIDGTTLEAQQPYVWDKLPIILEPGEALIITAIVPNAVAFRVHGSDLITD